TIPIASLFYGNGLVAANLTFAFFGFADPGVSHQICIETGILFWIFFLFALLPAKVLATPVGQGGFTLFRKLLAISASVSLLFFFIWYAVQPEIKLNAGFLSLLLTFVVAYFGWILCSCLTSLYSAFHTAQRKDL